MSRKLAHAPADLQAPNPLSAPETPRSIDADPAPPSAAPFDREQAIREVAYACFEARGGEPGHALDDWLKAEALVQQANGGLASVKH